MSMSIQKQEPECVRMDQSKDRPLYSVKILWQNYYIRLEQRWHELQAKYEDPDVKS